MHRFLIYFSMISALGLTGKSSSGNVVGCETVVVWVCLPWI
ncbi:hypothetical protein GLYMA_10G096220v4 [Glycine max]|nr:hypothetical protein GLYMA_10G096220v4 [Glycine max]KAH1137588.1 hypothetical protein GYH30_027547 [Glycine max]